MTHKPDVVRGRQAMLAGMTPVLQAECYVFCTTDSEAVVTALVDRSLALFREQEGATLVLEEADAREYGFDTTLPMSRIVLKVFSALDGVGLTAAVAAALADHGIACNMMAAYHHDNVFVPRPLEQEALGILKAVQRRAAEAIE